MGLASYTGFKIVYCNGRHGMHRHIVSWPSVYVEDAMLVNNPQLSPLLMTRERRHTDRLPRKKNIKERKHILRFKNKCLLIY